MSYSLNYSLWYLYHKIIYLLYSLFTNTIKMDTKIENNILDKEFNDYLINYSHSSSEDANNFLVNFEYGSDEVFID